MDLDPSPSEHYYRWKFQMVDLAIGAGVISLQEWLTLFRARIDPRSDPTADFTDAESQLVRFCRKLNFEHTFGTITAEAAEKSDV